MLKEIFAFVAAAGGLYYASKDTIAFGVIREIVELISMLIDTKIHAFRRNGTVWSFVDIFERQASKYPKCLQFYNIEGESSVMLEELEIQANRVAAWGLKMGLKQKDVVCLMMHNSSDFVAFWLGMAKIGVSTALLNTNSQGNGFLHSVEVSIKDSPVKIVVIEDTIISTLSSELADLAAKHVSCFNWSDLSEELATLPSSRPSSSLRNTVRERDALLFIFTSGTTGLPKAAKISHTKFYISGLPLIYLGYLALGVRMYCCLPLYHSAGGMVGVSACIQTGATMVIRSAMHNNYHQKCVEL
jgi:acyl-CoA synthetase (AMP-forming)/AMP-acid ligase II